MAKQASHVIVPMGKPSAQKQAKRRDPVASGERDATFNRAAGHNYHLLDRYEAGIILQGTEVKSIRQGHANLKDAYCIVKDGEAFLLNAHVSPYSHGNINNHSETRTRKLLLHKREIEKLAVEIKIKGLTIVPVRLYFKSGKVKCEIAVAKGKQDWDKRETVRRRDADREARAAIKAVR